MKNQGRIEELLSEALKKYDEMIEKQEETNRRLGNLESKSTRQEEQLVKLNLQTAENTRAIFKLSDRIESIVDHEKRIIKLESTVYK